MELIRTEPGVFHVVGLVRRERGPGDEIGESYEHWRRALVVMLGRLGSLRRDGGSAVFVSVAAPNGFADALLEAATHSGTWRGRLADEPHGADDGASSRLLHLWRIPVTPPRVVPVCEIVEIVAVSVTGPEVDA